MIISRLMRKHPMGTHCSGPSLLKSTGTELGQVYEQPLPYLLKVLSIRKALSIQVHPNKGQSQIKQSNC
ncbi:uncharacterized protein isoform X2 [Musca autumnalis]|uniref:uncharacterized protein isoform X2 n=1 Tax=Musca autumnalis TaxID=221902 RepID=UPI003CF9C7F8